MSWQYCFYFPVCAISLSFLSLIIHACTIFAVTSGLALADWFRGPRCWLTLLQGRGRFIHYNVNESCNAPNFSYASSPSSSPHLPSPYFLHTSVKHFVTWRTTAQTPTHHHPFPSGLIFCIVGLLVQCKWMCWSRLQSDCPWCVCTWMFYFVIKFKG